MINPLHATVVGGGLAGCEAAWQLAERGIEVTLFEMKPGKKSPAHSREYLAELVCSNSFRGDSLTNAVGLLKAEMRCLNSLILTAADRTSVPAGGALAVDRDAFSQYITEAVKGHPRIHILEKEITEIPDGPVIIATGPLTSGKLAEYIQQLPGLSTLHFYDAAAPIVYFESLNQERIFRSSRYQRGDDYLNCPLNEQEYNLFIDELVAAETAEIHSFEESSVFEGCMPIESMAKRGRMVPAFGPMKPVGLIDPRTGKRPFAVLQLRQDNSENTLYNLVGFQTRLTFPSQRRVFGLIPGMENAVYARYGTMHRNTFLASPGFLNNQYEMIGRPGCFFAGQMTGVEGYVESAGSGLVAGIALANELHHMPAVFWPSWTALGSMGKYIATPNRHFQPMNCSFGLIDPLPVIPGSKKIHDKKARYEAISERALKTVREIKDQVSPSRYIDRLV